MPAFDWRCAACAKPGSDAESVLDEPKGCCCFGKQCICARGRCTRACVYDLQEAVRRYALYGLLFASGGRVDRSSSVCDRASMCPTRAERYCMPSVLVHTIARRSNVYCIFELSEPDTGLLVKKGEKSRKTGTQLFLPYVLLWPSLLLSTR